MADFTYKYKTDDPFRVSKRRGRRKGEDPEQHERTAFKVAEIQAVHHQVKRLIFLGLKNKDIAEKLGITESTVSNIKNSPIIQDQLKLMQAAADNNTIDFGKQIEKIAPMALRNLEEIITQLTLNGQEVQVSLIAKESNSMIDRHIGKPTQNIRSEGMHAHFTADDIIKLKERALSQVGEKVTEAEVVTE